MILSNWLTDTVAVSRVETTVVNGITRPTDKPFGTFKGRIYTTSKAAPRLTEREPSVMTTEKLVVELGTGIKSGDRLMITRGGALGQTNAERYIAGEVVDYYEPVGGVAFGLAHTEIGLLLNEVI